MTELLVKLFICSKAPHSDRPTKLLSSLSSEGKRGKEERFCICINEINLNSGRDACQIKSKDHCNLYVNNKTSQSSDIRCVLTICPNYLLNGIVSCSRCYYVQIQPISQEFNWLVTDGRTDEPMDGWTGRTEGQTDGRTDGKCPDTLSYRDARTHLKCCAVCCCFDVVTALLMLDTFSSIVFVVIVIVNTFSIHRERNTDKPTNKETDGRT